MDEPISKSQKKRDADKLQQLGVSLIDLPQKKLDTFPLPPSLRDAILLARSLKSHGAIRRQAQLIGKMMRKADHALIAEHFDALTAEEKGQTALFHRLEKWRDRLLSADNDALKDFIIAFPHADLTLLRNHIKKAQQDKETHQSSGAHRALFRYLRSL